MKKASVLVVVVLALVVAGSATAADLPLSGAVAPALPPLPTVAPLPQVPSLPAVPSVPAVPKLPPLPSLPAVPDVPGAPRAPTVPSTSGGPNLPAAPGRSPGGSRGGGTAAPQAPGGRPSSGASGGESGSAAAGRTTGARARSGSGRTLTATSRARRERRLRRTVRRLQDCLGGLRGLERQVLLLRAGIGAGPPRSRARVARRLDMSTRRVARSERRGLRRLRGLAAAGRCGAGNASHVGLAAAGGMPFATGPLGQVTSAPRDHSEVKGERETRAGIPRVAPAGKDGLRGLLPATTVGGVDLTLPLLLVLAITGLLLAARAVRRVAA